MFLLKKKTVSVEGPSKQGQLEPTDKDSFRPAQPVGDVIETHSSEERGQMKRFSDRIEQRTGKQSKFYVSKKN